MLCHCDKTCENNKTLQILRRAGQNIKHFKQLLHIAQERHSTQSYRLYKFGNIDGVDYVPTYFRFKQTKYNVL